MENQLRPVPALHDLAVKAGAYHDKADPRIGIPTDSYVFKLDELKRFMESLKR